MATMPVRKKAAAVETLAAGLAREASLRAAAEIGAVVDMDGVRQSGNGPFFFYFALGQPRGFVVNRVKKTQTKRESRRRIHGQVESGHSAHENIHGQGDPRPTNRFARFLIDDGDIHPRVIDLDILKGRVARYSPAVALVAAILSLSSRRRACFRKSNSASLARTARQLGEARPSWTQRRRISSTRRANDARSGVKYSRSIVRRINRSRFGSSFLEPAARPHLRGGSAETVFSVLKRSINRKRAARLTPSAKHASGAAISGNRPGWSRVKSRSASSRRQASAHKSSRIFEALAARAALRSLDGLGEATRLIEAAVAMNGQGMAAAMATR
jgi:hypothetical protein